jgi:membrane protease YdiL (CAAX protease family)
MFVDSDPGILLSLGSFAIGSAAWLLPVFVFHHLKKARGEQLLQSVPFLAGWLLTVWWAWLAMPIIVTTTVLQAPIASMGFYFPWVSTLLWTTAFLIVSRTALSLVAFQLGIRDQNVLESGKSQASKVSYLKELAKQVVVLAFPEEVVNRGFILSTVLAATGPILGVVLSAFLFGLGHLPGRSVRFACEIFVAGLLYGFVFVYAGIVPCVIGHVFINLFENDILQFTFHA